MHLRVERVPIWQVMRCRTTAPSHMLQAYVIDAHDATLHELSLFLETPDRHCAATVQGNARLFVLLKQNLERRSMHHHEAGRVWQYVIAPTVRASMVYRPPARRQCTATSDVLSTPA